ncbi:MAG: hypothetical protein ABUU24_08535, partial [Variovorax sp.]
MWLRKHCFIFAPAATSGSNGDFLVAARDAVPEAELPPGIYEGPLTDRALARLGLSARLVHADTVTLHPHASTLEENDPECFEGLAYGQDVLRRIPAQRG